MEKQKIRNEIRKKLSKINNLIIQKNSKIICNKLLSLKEFKAAQNIGLYYSKDHEIETANSILKFLEMGKKVSLPKIKNQELEFKRIETLDEIETGKFNIKEPLNKCPTIKSQELDILIIPCLAIDEQGNRIGRGGGFYDKFLSQTNNIKTICIVHDLQILKKVPKEKHDKKIKIIISEKKIIKTESQILLDGLKLSKRLLSKIQKQIKKEQIKATLAVILVGNDSASLVYVNKKEEMCKQIGLNFRLIKYEKNITEEIIIKKIQNLNSDQNITGILVQLPLPPNLDTNKIINTINPEKDVDGLTDTNKKQLIQNNESLACCTPKGIIKLLEANKVSLKNKSIVLVGHGKLVGEPLATMLKNRNLNFKTCDKKTNNLKKETQKADILISAVGKPFLIKQDAVKVGAIVVDAGTKKFNNKLVGDVDFENLKTKVSKITPVPGGVGPMTIAMLMENILTAHKLQNKNLKQHNLQK